MKKFLQFLKAPPTWFLWTVWSVTLLAVAGSLTVVFIGYTGVPVYIVYALAAVTLGYSVYTFVRLAPRVKAEIIAALKKWKFTRELTENYHFRTLVFAAGSFLLNVGFVVFNVVMAIISKNAWYGSLAVYYLLLSVLRGGIFNGNKKAKIRAGENEKERYLLQLKNYRWCGIALFVLDLAMAVAVAFMVFGAKPSRHTDITAIVFAAYSFVKITMAIRNIFKAKKTQNPQIQAFRNIALADAVISLLSLQTTMVATFSEGDGGNLFILSAVVGACVCLFTMGMGILMIIHATKKIKREKENGQEI